MTSIIPFIIIILALAIIIVVLVKKYPKLVLLDVDNLPEFKQEKKKDEFIKKRVEKRAQQKQQERKNQLKPVVNQFKGIQSKFRKYVGSVERKVVEETQKRHASASPAKKTQRRMSAMQLLQSGDHAFSLEDYDLAEKKYIEALRIDNKSKQAYQGLSKVYFKQGQYKEAEETSKFLLHLNPKDEDTLMQLGFACEEQGKLADAVDYYQRAILVNDKISNRFITLANVLRQLERNDEAFDAIKHAIELEPQNPKYLDNLIEISIIVGDKKEAEEAYEALRFVNARNTKLPSFKERIASMQ